MRRCRLPLNYQPGDFLVFQLESGFALLRVLEREGAEANVVWHVAAYDDLFLDVDQAEAAINSRELTAGYPHFALTNRAFESTQVARLTNVALADGDLDALNNWRSSPLREISDRSVRLMIGLR
ncbi:MAG: hypothetical protein ABIV21_03195 [Pyrinomonadaceae bacterium]